MYKVFEKVSEDLGEVNQKFDNDELKYLQVGSAFGGQPPLSGGSRSLQVCHGRELTLAMMAKETSVNKEDAVDMVQAGKEKVFKDSDEDREKVVAVNGGVTVKMSTSSVTCRWRDRMFCL